MLIAIGLILSFIHILFWWLKGTKPSWKFELAWVVSLLMAVVFAGLILFGII